MVALLVIDLGPATSTITLGYASHFCRRALGTRRAGSVLADGACDRVDLMEIDDGLEPALIYRF
jgi:hypothetical protein